MEVPWPVDHEPPDEYLVNLQAIADALMECRKTLQELVRAVEKGG